MSFAHGREPEETSDEQLAEAMERADAWIRLAFPQLLSRMAERQRPQADPTALPVEHETATRVAKHLLDADSAVRAAAKELPLKGQLELHHHLNSILNDLQRLGDELVRRWDS